LNRFWNIILEPLITQFGPNTILEVGSDQGLTTTRLIDFCVLHRAHLEVIDPIICEKVISHASQYSEFIGLYRQNSLEALESVKYPDLALIDGDHNWFTVINELRILARRAMDEEKPFPLVILHDTGWPYGNRDLYYSPKDIPEQYRQPFAQLGIRPGESKLTGHGGINRLLNNAKHEYGERNGVKAAIDDFFSESPLQLNSLQISGFNGLFMIFPTNSGKEQSFVAELRHSFTPIIRQYISALENDRLRLELRSEDLGAQLISYKNEVNNTKATTDGGSSSMYLELLKRSLTDLIYFDGTDEIKRHEGQDWPPPKRAHTMIGIPRLNNLENCIEQVINSHVDGDFIEAGVWRGGAGIFMRGALKAFGDTSRQVWLADSFKGLPAPNPKYYPADEGDEHYLIESLAVSLETVKSNFRKYDLLDSRVRFVKGWFKDTLSTIPVQKFAIVRIDGDLYQSTMECLISLYPRLVVGGYLIVDDYGAVPACKKAVHDYRTEFNVTEPIQTIDWTGIFWQKLSEVPLQATPKNDSVEKSLEIKPAELFVLGAAKCATTAIHSWLDKNSEISMSAEKEPYFFEAEFEKGAAFYKQQYYRKSENAQIYGEARHRNLYLDFVPERIHQYNPEAKLLIVVRHPIERALSHWWHWFDRGEETYTLGPALIEDFARITRCPRAEPNNLIEQYKMLRESGNKYFENYAPDRRTYLDSGHYAEQISRYDQLFDSDQIKIIVYDDLLDHQEQTLQSILSFLDLEKKEHLTIEFPFLNASSGMENYFQVKMDTCRQESNNMTFSEIANLRHRYLLEPRLLSLLESYYRPHIQSLEARLKKSLHWQKDESLKDDSETGTVEDWLCALNPNLSMLLKCFGSLKEMEMAIYPLFDAEFYWKQVSLLGPTALTPFEHYLAHGGEACSHISPGPWFDVEFYNAQRHTDSIKIDNPLLHFLSNGFSSRLLSSPLLEWLQQKNETKKSRYAGSLKLIRKFFSQELRDSTKQTLDVKEFKNNDLVLLIDFIRSRVFDGKLGLEGAPSNSEDIRLRNYALERGISLDTAALYNTFPFTSSEFKAWYFGKLFDEKYYLNKYPDIKAAKVDPYSHFLTHGSRAGRQPSILFDNKYYRYLYPEVTKFEGDSISHYLTIGSKKNYNPHPLFNSRYYLSTNPEPKRANVTALEHYLLYGAQNRCDPSPEFDTKYYLSQLSAEIDTSEPALIHYLTIGKSKGLSTYESHKISQKLFDEKYYLNKYPDIKAAKVEPYSHFLTHGSRKGRQPSILFDNKYYRDLYPEVTKFEGDSISHYLSIGWKKNYNPHPLFNSRYYLSTNPEPKRADITALEHYLLYGAQNRCDPSPEFDTKYYLSQLSTEIDPTEPALIHYMKIGKSQELSTCDSGKIRRNILDNYLQAELWLPTSSTPQLFVYANSKGNFFMRQIADLYVAGLESVHVKAKRADEDTLLPPGALPIIIAPHEFFTLGNGPKRIQDLLKKSIVINTEQPDTPWLETAKPFLMKARKVFDLSPNSACELRKIGIKTYYLPLGYVKNFKPFDMHLKTEILDMLPGLPNGVFNLSFQDSNWDHRPVDIVMLAAASRYRQQCLSKLARTLSDYACYINLPVPSGAFVKSHGQITPEIAVGLSRSSKILINLHQSELPYFEWHRIVLLGIWQKTLIVTEPCEMIPGFIPGVHFIECSVDEMPNTLFWLLNTEDGKNKAIRICEQAYLYLTENMEYGELLKSRHLSVLFEDK